MTRPRSSGSHSNEYRDQLILNSSDEEPDRDEEDVGSKNIDREEEFPTTKQDTHSPYEKNGEHVYEDTD